MALITLRAGAQIDIPSRKEIADEFDEAHRRASARELEYARTIKPLRFRGPGPAVASGSVYLGDLGAQPASGYLWQVRLLSVQLSAADTVQAFIATSKPGGGALPLSLISNFGASATSQVASFNSDSVILNPDESIYLKAATQNITAFFMSGIEVSAEQFYKLVGA